VLGRLFGYGNVWINGSGTRQVIRDVADPTAFQAAIHKRLDESRFLKGTAAYTLDVRLAADESHLPATAATV
jgi:hypothetical protein